MKSLLGTLCIAAGIAVPCPSSPGGEPEGWVLVLSSADMLKDSFLLKSSDQQMNLNLFRNVFETTEFKDQLPGIGDSSMEKVSEVSRPMRDILSRLRDTVHVRYYLSKELPGAFADLRNETIALLEKMAAVSGGHLGYDVVEPDEEARAYAAAKVESYYAALGEGKTPPEPRQESIEDLFKGRPRKTDAEIRGERKEKAAAISRDPKAGVSAEDLYRKIITEEFREVYLADLEKRGIRSVPFMERKGEESIETVLFSSIEVKYLSREPEVLPVHFQVQSLEHELALMVLKLTAKSRPKFLFFDGRKPQAKPSNPMDPGAARSASEHSAVMDACRELFDLEEITLEEGD